MDMVFGTIRPMYIFRDTCVSMIKYKSILLRPLGDMLLLYIPVSVTSQRKHLYHLYIRYHTVPVLYVYVSYDRTYV